MRLELNDAPTGMTDVLARQVEKTPDINARENLLRLIKVHSLASWGHINMVGKYDFFGRNAP